MLLGIAATTNPQFLLTRPMRGATRKVIRIRRKGNISTHTPHAERDSGSVYSFTSALPFLLTRPMRGATSFFMQYLAVYSHFYSHAPCGARQILFIFFPFYEKFLLTRPMRGATFPCAICIARVNDFYSHAPCGARHNAVGEQSFHQNFYSHAPCGARPAMKHHPHYAILFLLTRPMRGATYYAPQLSTHLDTFLLTRPMRGATKRA